MQTLGEIKQLLAERGLSPRHALGQNFLIDKNLLGKLVDAAGLSPGQLVLEVGPGTGTLTETLLARGHRVIACELDDALADLLTERLSSNPNFTLVRGDCLGKGKVLNADAAKLLGDQPFALVANLPYGAATPLMLNLLIDWPTCASQAVTIQKEVAQRLLAKPGTRDFGTLGVVAQAMGEVSMLATLPPECFWPRPDITSAMVLIKRREVPLTREPAKLAAFSQKLFMSRRKQLGATLGRTIAWPVGVEPTMRAEQLSIEQMVALCAVAG